MLRPSSNPSYSASTSLERFFLFVLLIVAQMLWGDKCYEVLPYSYQHPLSISPILFWGYWLLWWRLMATSALWCIRERVSRRTNTGICGPLRTTGFILSHQLRSQSWGTLLKHPTPSLTSFRRSLSSRSGRAYVRRYHSFAWILRGNLFWP